MTDDRKKFAKDNTEFYNLLEKMCTEEETNVMIKYPSCPCQVCCDEYFKTIYNIKTKNPDIYSTISSNIEKFCEFIDTIEDVAWQCKDKTKSNYIVNIFKYWVEHGDNYWKFIVD
jgi:hypothetical protein